MDVEKADLNLLVVFDALLRVQSVSRTAEVLDMSQPAVSFALAKLRTLFDDQLFVRTGRGVRPTPRAEQLGEPLRRILDQISNELLRPANFDPATSQRRFTLNMSDVGELVFLPKILSYLRREAPGVLVRTMSCPQHQLTQALESGEVDLAIGHFPDLKGAGVYQQRLMSHSFACIVAKNHPRIDQTLSLDTFLDANHVVVLQEGKKGPDLFEQALADQGVERRVVLEIPHFLALPLLIADSDLIATVPFAVAERFSRMSGLKVLRPPVDTAAAHVMQHWHARFHGEEANIWLRGVFASLFLEAPRGCCPHAESAPD